MVVLWIVPSDEDSAKLKTITSIHSATSTGSETRSYPKFHPHITLAAPPSSSTLTLEQLREAISNSLSANLQVSFKSVNTGNHFFRSVYISIEPTPALVSLHTQIHNTLNLEPRTPLFPHLSLCYITDEDDAKKEERQRWKNQLEASSRIRYTGSSRNGIELNCCGDDAVDDWITGFTAYEIWFVDCVGPVESWSVLDKVRL